MLTNMIEQTRQCSGNYKFMETMFDFFFKLAGRYDSAKQWLLGNKKNWEWMIEWLNLNRQPPNQMNSSNQMRLLKKRANTNYLQM